MLQETLIQSFWYSLDVHHRILRKINLDNAVGTFLCTISQPFSMTKLEFEILDAFGFRYCYYKINHRRSNRLPIYISKINTKAFHFVGV